MITIEKRSNIQGAEKYGNCVSCGTNQDVYKITFNDGTSSSVSISLCLDCLSIFGDYAIEIASNEANQG